MIKIPTTASKATLKAVGNFTAKLMLLALASLLMVLTFSVSFPATFAGADELQLQNEPPDIDPDDVAHFSLIQHKLFRVPDGYTAGIWGILNPDEVELPAIIQVAVPTGANVFWFGPIPEGGVTPDSPQFEDYHVYTDTEKGLDIYTALLTDSYEVNLEHYFWGEGFLFPVRSLDNGDHVIRISYTPLHDVDILSLAAFLPPGSAARDEANVNFLGTGPTGDPAFSMEFPNARGGETYTAEIEYAPPEITARQDQPTITGGILVVIAATVAAIAVILGFLLVIKARKNKNRRGNDDDYNDTE